jgi:hypothetical protein
MRQASTDSTRSTYCRWFFKESALVLAASAICLRSGQCAQGATRTWTADSGDWATAGNWSGDAVPKAGDTVDITDDDNTSRDVLYNYTGTAITLGNVTVDNDGATGINTLSMTGSGTNLAAPWEYIGDSNTSTLPGFGVMNQSVGTNSITNGLYLGFGPDDEGTYSLSATGTLTASGEVVGNTGTGVFYQSGGVNDITNSGGLYIAGVGATGNYYLSGGTLELTYAGAYEVVGDTGSGTFTQTGGANNCPILQVDSGLYSLSLGTLLAGSEGEYIGFNSSGTFQQSGGANTTTGGVYIGYAAGGPDGDSSLYALSGGSLSVGGDLEIGDGTLGTFSLSAAGSLSVSGTESVGYSGTGNFNQTGGTNTPSSLDVGVSATGTYTLSGGTLSVNGAEIVGQDEMGNFNQTGGTNTLPLGSSLFLGDGSGPGLYNLSGTGVLTVSGDEDIGYSGTAGDFTQTDATTNTITGNLEIGCSTTASGGYDISGAGSTLTVQGNVDVGGNFSAAGGSASFNVEGGQVTITGTLQVWNSPGTEVFISGGNTTAGNMVNLAVYDQTGGTASLGAVSGTGTMVVGQSSGVSASLTITALTQHLLDVESTGTVKLMGGASNNTLNQLTINGSGIFDITNGHFYIDYGTNPDPISTIRAYLISGFNSGGWNGPGIDSSTATANSLSYGLGYADSADPGNPANLPSGIIEVAYTLLGDCNLDRVVNGIDFGILAANFNKGVSRWDQGDFNYDNVVNGIDFGELAANFNQGASGADIGPPVIDDPAVVAFAQANGLMADVPEPACGGCLLVAAIGALTRRRRKSDRRP